MCIEKVSNCNFKITIEDLELNICIGIVDMDFKMYTKIETKRDEWD